MKISDKQVHQLIALLQSSLTMDVQGYLCYNHDTRQQMLNEIINQQDDDLKELGDGDVRGRTVA